jgi:hypothetical protein
MDPITLMAGVAAAFNGLKHAVSVGREVQDVFGQLSKWADSAGQLQDFINRARDPNYQRKPSIFQKIGFEKSETSEALDLYAYQQKLREMEAEIQHMFYYGALHHLGQEGYREFIQLRKKVREDRERMIREHAERRQKFIENTFWGSLLIIAVFTAYEFFLFIFNYGREAGKW